MEQLHSQELKQKIVKALSEKVSKLECPICHHEKFILVDGYFNSIVQKELKAITIGGSSIPSIGIVCSHCGFISHHALGVLGLLDSVDSKQEDNEQEVEKK